MLETPNFLSIFLYPIFLVSISPVLLDISSELGIKPASLNLVLSFLIIGNIAGQLTSSLYNIKFRKFTVISMLYIILLPLVVSLFFITKLYLFYIVYFACGYILGVVWIQANAFLLDSKIENKNRLINVALIFFPVGAVIAPLLSIAVSALNLSWRYLYAVIIFLIALTLASYVVLKRKNKKEASAVEEKFKFKEVFAYKYQNRIFIISVLTLFFYGISETVIYTWSPTFFRLDRLMPPEFAGLTVTVFWLAVTIGRIFTGIILCRVKPYIYAGILSVMSLASLLFMILTDKVYLTFLAVFLVGLGYSGIFPLIFSNACLLYPKGRSMLETSLFVSTSLGAAIAPYLTGLMINMNIKYSISVSPVFMAAVLLLIILNIINYKKYIRNQNVC